MFNIQKKKPNLNHQLIHRCSCTVIVNVIGAASCVGFGVMRVSCIARGKVEGVNHFRLMMKRKSC